MQIVDQVHSLNLLYFPFFHKFLAFLYIQTFFYTIMNLFITLFENVNKPRTSANNVSLSQNLTIGLNLKFPAKTLPLFENCSLSIIGCGCGCVCVFMLVHFVLYLRNFKFFVIFKFCLICCRVKKQSVRIEKLNGKCVSVCVSFCILVVRQNLL
jgi:hypothetical protein